MAASAAGCHSKGDPALFPGVIVHPIQVKKAALIFEDQRCQFE
jgi:hypothetical protein